MRPRLPSNEGVLVNTKAEKRILHQSALPDEDLECEDVALFFLPENLALLRPCQRADDRIDFPPLQISSP